MNIKNLQKNWDTFGRVDPFHAILTYKKGKDWQVKEFFMTGVEEVDKAIKYIKDKLKITIPRKKALDFGCGVGRVTQALASYFDKVYGVDIAPSMVELANKYNRHPKRVVYCLNEKINLKIFPNSHFDFIYSNITLQHMKPQYTLKYLEEFLRILKNQGLLIFQLPSHRNFLGKIKETFLKLTHKISLVLSMQKNEPVMEMYGIPQKEIIKFLQDKHANLLKVEQNDSSGKYWISYLYFVLKQTS